MRLVGRVHLFYSVHLDCLVERDKPDEPDRPSPPVSLGHPAQYYSVISDVQTSEISACSQSFPQTAPSFVLYGI